MYLSQLIYLSDAAVDLSRDDLVFLAHRSAQANAGRDITGVLYYGDGHFIQVLEGPLREVNALFEHIRLDARHHRVKLLSFLPIRGRAFPAWGMGLINDDQRFSLDRRRITAIVDDFAQCEEGGVAGAHGFANRLCAEFRRQLGEPKPVL